MRRIRLVVAYDGTNYVGWQRQPNGLAIEEVLTEQLRRILKEDVVLIGASRTDSGVHALGNIAVFDTSARIPAEKIAIALNTGLPGDIAVQRSEEVPLTWHPRKVNSQKTYEYRILNRPVPLPAERLTSWFYHHPLNLEVMQDAASCLTGEHDFKSFCSIHTDVEDTVRTLYSVTIRRKGDMVIFRLVGNGFLYNMVRILVGSLVQVGCGLKDAEWFRQALDARDRAASGPMAPARGLTLISIREDKELPDVQDEDNPHWSYRIDYTGLKRNDPAGSEGSGGTGSRESGQAEPEESAGASRKESAGAGRKKAADAIREESNDAAAGKFGKARAVRILIRACADPKDWEPLLVRLCKRAARNGAGKIFVEDQTGNLRDGDDAAYFHFHQVVTEPRIFVTWDPKTVDTRKGA